ncbi:uncharacterized protein RAG0_06726 [Rhynchosporium agropyri]|uniref:Uncharacterized protein n=1 Tax=Rhynchosporium agropyri TaxID=914238 RepID=A0A1E1KIG3_9HELO|nr:uncharacterized protein RAG0_06726 [Rhynchosporium agropyri]
MGWRYLNAALLNVASKRRINTITSTSKIHSLRNLFLEKFHDHVQQTGLLEDLVSTDNDILNVSSDFPQVLKSPSCGHRLAAKIEAKCYLVTDLEVFDAENQSSTNHVAIDERVGCSFSRERLILCRILCRILCKSSSLLLTSYDWSIIHSKVLGVFLITDAELIAAITASFVKVRYFLGRLTLQQLQVWLIPTVGLAAKLETTPLCKSGYCHMHPYEGKSKADRTKQTNVKIQSWEFNKGQYMLFAFSEVNWDLEKNLKMIESGPYDLEGPIDIETFFKEKRKSSRWDAFKPPSFENMEVFLVLCLDIFHN